MGVKRRKKKKREKRRKRKVLFVEMKMFWVERKEY